LKRLVCNVVAGEYAFKEHSITGPNHRAYADRIGAEYQAIIRDVAPSYAPAVKWMISRIAQDYDQVLLLDVDTVINPHCPNIFDEVPLGYFGVIDESSRVASDANWDANCQRDADAICDQLNIPSMTLIRRINSGVMVLPSNAIDYYWPPSKPVPKTWCFEQLYLSMRLQSDHAPVVELDWRYNWCAGHHHFDRCKDQAFIIHLAGMKDRLSKLATVVNNTKKLSYPQD
jgi:hypothetical protein